MNEKVSIERIFGLDLLRSISIAMVLFSHSSWIYMPKNIMSKVMDTSGLFGVEIFFVMSGFLVGGIIYKHFLNNNYTIIEVRTFLLRRLMRVMPSYYLALFINSLIYLYFGVSIAITWKYYLFIQNFSTPIPIFFAESWSLPIKELGYIFVVLLLLLFGFFLKISKKTLFLTVVIGLILLSIVFKIIFNLNNTNLDLINWSYTIRAVTIYRIDSVLIGVILGFLNYNYSEFLIKYRRVFFMIGLFLFTVLVYCIMVLKLKIESNSWFWNICCLPFISIIIAMFFPVVLNWKSAPKTIKKVTQFICDLSYSIYLIHYGIVLLLMKYIIDTTHFNNLQLHVFTFFYLIITIMLSYIFYNYFEKPINNFRKANFKLNGK